MATTTQVKKNKKIGNGGAMDLRTIFGLQLQFLSDIETQQSKALPAMAKKVADGDLKEIFENHVAETRDHDGRLTKICASLGIKLQKLESHALRGLIADFDWLAKNVKSAEARDAALLASLRCI